MDSQSFRLECIAIEVTMLFTAVVARWGLLPPLVDSPAVNKTHDDFPRPVHQKFTGL